MVTMKYGTGRINHMVTVKAKDKHYNYASHPLQQLMVKYNQMF